MGLWSALTSWLPWKRVGAKKGSRRRGRGWWTHPKAPLFHVEPGVDQLPDGNTFRVLMTLRQLGGSEVEASLRARWRGGGLPSDFVTPMLDVRERPYQMKPIIADATAASDSEIEAEHLAFELRFDWNGEERHMLWIWPMRQDRLGRWFMEVTGANTDQPAEHW